MSKSNSSSTPPRTDSPGRYAMPDHRLNSLFIKPSSTAPAIARKVGILGTYAPTICGLASFASALRDGLIHDRPEIEVGIVRIASEPGSSDAAEVVHELSTTDNEAGDKAAAAELNKFDVAVIQHEFGIFGGSDGDQVLRIMNWIRVPMVVVAHTVPANPTPSQEKVLATIVETADALVAMSETARQRLITNFLVPEKKVTVIQHGAKAAAVSRPVLPWPPLRPTILTWGLLGPGKGIEWGISAMPALSRLRPLPRYVVAGQTHPKVLARDGESYRESLMKQAERLGVAHMVQFEGGYLSRARLGELMSTADVVLVPYDSRDQVTSGVLVEAIAARIPVVATGFPQAQELLSSEHGGLLVAHQDPEAMAAALGRILTEPELAARLVAHTGELTAVLAWSQVAALYRQLFDALVRRPTASSR